MEQKVQKNVVHIDIYGLSERYYLQWSIILLKQI